MNANWPMFLLWSISSGLILVGAWWCLRQLRYTSRLLVINRELTERFANSQRGPELFRNICAVAQTELEANGVTVYLQQNDRNAFERAAEVGRSAEETGPGLVRDLLVQACKTGQLLESQYGGRSIVAAPLNGFSSEATVPAGESAPTGAFLVVWEGSRKLSKHQRQQLDLFCGFALLASDLKPEESKALAQAEEQINTMHQERVEEHHLASVGRLAAGVAHELNTPLGAVLTMVSSLQRNETDANRAKRLKIIRDAVEKSKSIIEKLLVYSRDPVETENGLTFSRFVRADASLNQVIESHLELLSETLDAEGIKVDANLGELPALRINSTQFGSIVNNLISNARDALKSSKTEQPTIFIKTYVDEDKAVLEFGDNGPGIPDDIRKKVFQPFFTTKDIGKGTGLGLAIVSETIRKHQGQVHVSNRSEGGAFFRITLPLFESTKAT
jgi:signal transduction histidine kinase